MREDMGDIKTELKSIRASQEKAAEDDKKEKEAIQEQFKTLSCQIE